MTKTLDYATTTITLDEMSSVANFLISLYSDYVMKYGKTSLATIELLETPVWLLHQQAPGWELPEECVCVDESLYQYLQRNNISVYQRVVFTQEGNTDEFVGAEHKMF